MTPKEKIQKRISELEFDYNSLAKTISVVLLNGYHRIERQTDVDKKAFEIADAYNELFSRKNELDKILAEKRTLEYALVIMEGKA